MTPLLLTLMGTLCALFLSAVCSGLETAAYGTSAVRLRCLAEQGNARARAAQSVLGRMAKLLTTLLISNNIVNYFGAYFITAHLAVREIPHAEIIATLLVTPLFFLFGEVLPKRLAYARSESYFLSILSLTRFFMTFFAPLGLLVGGISVVLWGILTRLGYKAVEPTGRSMLAEHLDAGVARRFLTEAQRSMASRILAAEETTVEDVMIPTAKAFSVPRDATCREAAAKMINADYRRAPLADKNGRLTGEIVILAQLLREEGSLQKPVTALCVPMIRLDAETPVIQGLQAMKNAHVHVALVTGQGSAPCGIVSLGALLGNIVGSLKLK